MFVLETYIMRYLFILIIILGALGCDSTLQPPIIYTYVHIKGKCKPNSFVDFNPRNKGREALVKADNIGNFYTELVPGKYRVLVRNRKLARKFDIESTEKDSSSVLDLR